MADDAGKQVDDLRTDPGELRDVDFFQLLRVLERGGGRFGRGTDPADEPARLGQAVRLNFSTRDVAQVTRGGPGKPLKVEVELFGLLGPEGPLPLHLTRWTFDRMSERWFTGDDRTESDTTFRDLCNLMQHRVMSLFWRAWADTRPEIETERETQAGRVYSMLAAMAGIGLPRSADDPLLDPIRLRQAAGLGLQPKNPERLTLFLTEMLGAQVELEEFVGNHIAIPSHLQSRLGLGFASLGKDAIAGGRSFQRQNKMELRIGPLGLAAYQALFPDRPTFADLRRAVLYVNGSETSIDLRLVLDKTEIPDPVLGNGALGRTFWLPDPHRDAHPADFRVRHVCGAPETMELVS